MGVYCYRTRNHVTNDKEKDLGRRPIALPNVLDFLIECKKVVVQKGLVSEKKNGGYQVKPSNRSEALKTYHKTSSFELAKTMISFCHFSRKGAMTLTANVSRRADVMKDRGQRLLR